MPSAQNILIKSRPPDDEWWVKIADFGISMRCQKTAGAEVMGTPGYIAPELLNLCENGSLFAADMWAFGETIFRILTKRVAFSGETLPRYAKGEISFPVEKLLAVQVSQPGVDFIVSLMRPLPTDRVSVYMATKNPWIDPTSTGPQNSNTGLETLGDGDPPGEPTDQSDQRTPNGKHAQLASADLDLPGSESQDLNGGTPSSASAQLNIGKQLCGESQNIKNFERVSAHTDVRTSAQPTGESHSLYVSVNTISSSASRGSYPRLTTGDKHKLSTSPMAPLRSPPLSVPSDPVTEPLTKPLNVDLQEQNPLPFFAYELQSVAFSPDGKFLASGSAGVVRIRDISTGAEIMSLTGHNGDVRALAFSPDGSRLATGCSDGTIRLWRTSKWEYIRTLSGHTGLIKTLLFSPENSSTLASASADGTVRVWHLSKMQAYIVRTDTAEHDYIALSFTCSGSAGYGDGSPGTYLLAACWRRIYHVTVDTGYSTSWETLADRLSGLCISPDQQLVAGVSHDDPGAISIMDIRPRNFQSRGETFLTLKCSAKLFQYEMQFSPDGRLLVARAQGPVTIVDEFPRHCLFIWDVATGQEILRREFFAFSVPIFAFSPDGSLIAAPALSRGEFSAFPASNVVRIWTVAQVDASE
jgi:WD40 repeat protein